MSIWFRWAAKAARYSAAPGDMLVFDRMWAETDVRDVLPAIQVPTSVIYRAKGDQDEAEYVASKIPGATLVRSSSRRPSGCVAQRSRRASAKRSGRSSDRSVPDQAAFDRLLATVMFTDIVDSTSQSAAMGDLAWGKVQDAHDQIVRAQLARFHGHEVRTMGDGFLATFDGPDEACGARRRSPRPFARSASRSAPVSTRGRSSSPTVTCRVSPWRSELEWERSPVRARSWCRAR